MAALNNEQKRLLDSLGIGPLDGMNDNELEQALQLVESEMQLHGLNDAGNGLNAHGELCRSILAAIAEDDL